MKKATMTIAQAISSTAIVEEIVEEVVNPTISLACSSSGQAAEKPVPARRPGFSRSSAVSVPPPAVRPGLGERPEDDVGERREAVQDQREDADIEDLLEEAADDIVLAAQRPEESGKRDVDADQYRRQESPRRARAARNRCRCSG
jgi:hypothetical protein